MLFRKFIIFIVLLGLNVNIQAQATIDPDVIHYDINLTSINASTSTIIANTAVTFVATQVNTGSIRLSLLKLIVDSIRFNNQNLSYTYNDTTLIIQCPSLMFPNDTSAFIIYYHGNPKQDPLGWGGFYFSGNFVFNMGVGLGSYPHNLGKIWFPCNDSFTDKATYNFNVTTTSTNKAFCSGTLIGQTTLPNSNIIWSWEMNDEIPTYLASVAIAPYHTLNRNYNNIPVEIACLVSDTNAVNGTFVNLGSVLGNYINSYGPYPFDKVGFCLIPFNSGAMEHASSIHIGKPFVNGLLTYETLWAHELSHMWWGDKVTCETEGDMWLNEGLASFNEAYTTEFLYGKNAYKDWIRSNHRKVLQSAHIDDQNYLSLINVPTEFTYGTTVYNKGADVAHTLRNYMKDSLFFNGCKYYMNNRAYKNANSYNFRDDLSTSSSINMNRFFDDWIVTQGFPHFSIDSIAVQAGVSYTYTIYTRQRSKGNSHLYEMPIELYFSNGNLDTTIELLINQNLNVFTIQLPFYATWITLDKEEKVSDATTDYIRKIFNTGVFTFPETNAQINVQNIGADSSIIRVEHNWVKPDNFKQSNPGIRLSDYHYWKVDGIFSSGFKSKATFLYNGSANATTGNIDNTLITGAEDSLTILYRSNTGDDWNIVSGYTLNKSGSSLDKIGNIVIDTLKIGEYCFGYRDYTVGIEESKKSAYDLLVWPNPSDQYVNIIYNGVAGNKYQLTIYDTLGQLLFSNVILSGEQITWRPKLNTQGNFVVKIGDKHEILATKNITVTH